MRLLCTALVVCLSLKAGATETKATPPLWTESAQDPVPSASNGPPDFTAVAKAVRPSVVSITAIGSVDNIPSDTEHPTAREFFERFYGGADPPTKGMASGFVIRSDGYILTNEHVVEEAAGLAVTLGGEEDGRSYPAVVVGRDDLSDLALIKIDAGRPLTPLPLGDSRGLAVGDWVTAIGNPFGLSSSVSVGVISFIGRRDINPSGRPGYYDFIQTDAAINPGNSGGPLVDRTGRVVGISAAVNANGQGIGFAIPINMAKDVLPALFETGTLRRSFLGVSIQDLSPDLADSFGVKEGVVVTEVSPESPAARAGVMVGDVITAFDGAKVERSWRLRWLASGAGAGHHVKLDLLRKKSPLTVEAALVALPGTAEKFHREPLPHLRRELEPLGFAVGGTVNVSTGHGVRVSSVDPLSRAYVAGLREGDVLLAAQDKPMKSPRDLQSLASRAKGSVVRLFIQRGVRPMFVAFRCG
jgi:serine protease Do